MVNRSGAVKAVKIRRTGRFTTLGGRSWMTKGESIRAKKWALNKKKAVRVYRTRSKYPFLVLDTDTKMVRAPLAKKLNRLGQKRRKFIFINEGWRTHARQWELWNLYKSGRGNLAAYPGTSNHEGGNAADCSFFTSGTKSGNRINVGADAKCRKIMKSLGICLPVSGENWHCELGNTWRA